jgi:ketosteroid isomerase-like protein
MKTRALQAGLAVAAVVLSAAILFSLPKPADDMMSKEIEMVLGSQRSAWNRGDLDGFMKGYWQSPELTFSSSGGVTRGWQPVMERYQQRYKDAQGMGFLDFSELEVHPLGMDAAFVLGKWHLKRGTEELGGSFTLVFQRFADGWKIVHDHTSINTGK